jgi:hypothetical protein
VNGYFGNLMRQTGLSVASLDPRPSASAFGDEGNGPHTEFGGLTQETVEIAGSRPEPVFDPPLPRPHASGGHEPPGPSGSRRAPAEPRAQELIASRYEDWEAQRADSPRESRVEERTGPEGRANSTVPRVPTADAARVHSPMGGEPPVFLAIARPDAPPPVEQHEGREIRDSRSGLPPPIRVVNRESKEAREGTFERAQVWHDTYRLVRDWVAASPSAEEIPGSIERHDFVEAPPARPAIVSPGMAPAPAESPSREPSAVPEIHVSIGTISVVVDEPAAEPPAPQQTREIRQEPAASSDWTRRRRLYIRSL